MLDLHSRGEPTVFIERWLGPFLRSVPSSRPLREDPRSFFVDCHSSAHLAAYLWYDSWSFFCTKVLTPHNKRSCNFAVLAPMRFIFGEGLIERGVV